MLGNEARSGLQCGESSGQTGYEVAEDGTGEPYEKQHQQQQLHTVHRELLLVLMSASNI